MVCHDKWKNWRYNALRYDDQTTKMYLDKVLPKFVARSNIYPTRILLSDTDGLDGIQFYWDWTSLRMRRINKKAVRYFRKFWWQVEIYIINTYQIDGYNKMTFNNFKHWQAAKDIFSWEYIPCVCEHCHGVLFYKED